MDTKDLLKKVRKIEIKTRKLSDHIFGGEYHSTFKGKGMTFSEVRQYQIGDDIRSIDWNVTARYNEPFVKIFEEEREQTLMLMVDVSASKFFGTNDIFKNEYVTEIAATLSFSANQNNDKIGLILFTDIIELYIPPKKGKTHILRIIRELLEFKPKNKKTDIQKAFKFLSNIQKNKSIVFIISDFISSDYFKSLKISSSRHDITGIRIFDKCEESIPNLGIIEVIDSESGGLFTINTSSPKVRSSYEKQYLFNVKTFENNFKRSGAGVINCGTEDSYVKQLLGYFKNRS